ncbi:MAG: NADH dehydrogenase (quinone) subunit D [Candidatus Dormibacteria bacterium]
MEKIESADELMEINMGPQHPSTHGVLRLVLSLDGERVRACRADIGYLHTGFEKSFESHTYQQCIPLTDRMDYLAPPMNNLGFALTVEKLLDLEIPPRGQYLRVIIAELSRIASHVIWLGTHALDLGATTLFMYTWRERDQILDILEWISGVRMMTSFIRVGGLMADVPEEFVPMVRAFTAGFQRRVDEYEGLLTSNPIWRQRTIGLGVISAAEALGFGCSGPTLRGSGVPYDIRRAQPYSSYDQFDFQVPVGVTGDVYDRYLVRVREMRESCRIIDQAIQGLPGGPTNSHDRKVTLPPRSEIDTSMESLIHHFKLTTEGFRVAPGSVYHAIESPRGELGFLMVSDGGTRPYRCKVRAPSFSNLSALHRMVQDELVADAVAVVGSIDITLGDVDR